jgi:integrase
VSKITLTDLVIQRLSEGTHWDDKLPNFGVRKGKNRTTFITRVGKERRDIAIGHYPALSLKEARQRAMVELGAPREHRPLIVSEALKAFTDDARKRLKPDTLSQYLSYLSKLDAATKLTDITKVDVNKALSAYDGKKWAQNYCYAALRAFLNWCLEQEYIDKHPLIHGRPPNKVRSRDRVLSDEELARVWRCTGDATYGRILRLLILTGQRRMEVRNIAQKDIQNGLITFHTKGDKTNILPITPMIEDELKNVPFHFNNWSGAKDAFDIDCGVDFRNHDIRRTLATRMLSLGVTPVVVESILGHTIGGVAGVYQRYDYMKEKRETLLLWEAHLRKIISA